MSYVKAAAAEAAAALAYYFRKQINSCVKPTGCILFDQTHLFEITL